MMVQTITDLINEFEQFLGREFNEHEKELIAKAYESPT